MDSKDLQAELDELWARVNQDDPEDHAFPEFPSTIQTDSPVRDASVEALQLLRRQREAETTELRHLLAVRERAVSDLNDRLRSAQAEIVRLRQQQAQRDKQVLADVLQVSAKLEEAKGTLREAEDRSAAEERVLRDIAEKTRQQLAGETARWRELERQWNEREQQYLLDLKEAQTLLKRAEDAAGKADDRARRVGDDLKTAKGAVEATLAELLTERKLRETADQERDHALKKVREVEEHFAELQKIWQEERKQWNELWDRERSSWDARQQELSTWQDRFRKERDSWHADFQVKEQTQARFAEQVSKSLRESSEASARLAGVLKALRVVGGDAPIAPVVKKVALAAASVALMISLGVPAYRYAVRLRATPVALESVAAENATAIAFDGNLIWVAEWSGRLLALDPTHPSRIVNAAQVTGANPYHPTALAAAGDTLWSVDTAQARILRHSAQDPAVVRDAWAAPGPAPLAIAHDGTRLWSYDAVNRMLYRHDGEGPNAPVRGYAFELDVVPTSMQWTGPDLWLHDSKGHRLLRLASQESRFVVVEELELPSSVLSVSVRASGGAKGMLTLAPAAAGGGAYAIQSFELKGR